MTARRILIGIVTATAAASTVVLVLSTGAMAGGEVTCATWNVDGTWTTRQSNTGPPVTFSFHQAGSGVKGSARVGPVSENFHGTLAGRMKGDKLVFVVTWNELGSDGQPLKGHYAGNVSAGHITGSTYALNAPEQAVWSAVGAAHCG